MRAPSLCVPARLTSRQHKAAVDESNGDALRVRCSLRNPFGWRSDGHLKVGCLARRDLPQLLLGVAIAIPIPIQPPTAATLLWQNTPALLLLLLLLPPSGSSITPPSSAGTSDEERPFCAHAAVERCVGTGIQRETVVAVRHFPHGLDVCESKRTVRLEVSQKTHREYPFASMLTLWISQVVR